MFKKITLGVLMIAVLSTALASPAEARRRRGGRGFGLAAGLIGAGIASSAFNRGFGGYGYGGYGGFGGYAPYGYAGYGGLGGFGGYSPYAFGAAPYGYYGNGFAPYGGFPYRRRRRNRVLPILIGAAAIAAIASSR